MGANGSADHRADAVRVLNFAHAAGHIADIGDHLRLLGQSLPTNWLESLLHPLKHEGTPAVLEELHIRSKQVGEPDAIEDHVRYLCKRETQMDYPTLQRNGWPIGSGMVESGNKLVMQARLKGAGMHWEPKNVNPMLALRMNLCTHRWQGRVDRPTALAANHTRTEPTTATTNAFACQGATGSCSAKHRDSSCAHCSRRGFQAKDRTHRGTKAMGTPNLFLSCPSSRGYAKM